ncbi:MAG: AzlC family ABC transporter permease [Tissierellia bacterium]|nr:AzlC family ABC transporter permease [Tissierellia bacterium]
MENKTLKDNIKEGFVASLPIVIGYFPIAIAFGLMAKNISLTIWDTSLLSILVYAGASQFMALELILAGVSPLNIVIATFLLNIRHMMMTASLSVEFENIPRKSLPIIGFGITDETFSVISFNKDKINLPYVSIICLLSYLSWVAGTVIGYGVGEILPESLQTSLSIGLYAMFAALLFPEFKNSNKTLLIALIAAAIYIIIYYTNILNSGWDIIAAIVLSSWIGVLVFAKNEEVRN